MKKTVLAAVGPMAAGKGTLIEILKKKGFESSSTSDRIREEIRRRRQEVNRKSLTDVGDELRQKFGEDVLAQRTAEYIKNSESEYFVIDSIRNPKEIEFFKNKYGMRIISIDADQKVRYERFTKRKTNSEPMTFEEFKTLDDAELYGSKGSHSQRVADCMKMADFRIENVGSVGELEKQVDKALQKLSITIN